MFIPPRIRRLIRLNDLITGYWVSQAVYVAAKLGLPDALARGARSADEIAGELGASSDALYRLMRALAAAGVLREDRKKRFRLTPLGEQLRSGAPGSLRHWAIYNGERWHWGSWGDLLHAVRTGATGSERALGRPLFDYLAATPDAGRIFDAAMADLATIDNVSLVSSFPFGRARVIVDVGGGNGALLTSILNSYPRARGVLFDAPAVADAARENIAAAFGKRCAVTAGNFLESVPGGGALYILKQVLHDWDDERATRILTNCAAAMRPDTRLLIVEIVVPAHEGASIAKLTDLEMLVMTGGRERTLAEYRALLRASEMRYMRAHATRTPFTIIEAAKR